MRKRTILFISAIFIVAAVGVVGMIEPEYAYMPRKGQVLNDSRSEVGQGTSYDIWGVTVTPEEAAKLMETEDGMEMLSPSNGTVEVDQDFVELGREIFYKETFDNEIYITDILGMLDGPISVTNIAKAILELRGGQTDNLQVELAENVTIGGKHYAKGDKIDTGLDVPKGALAPLGMPISFKEGRLKAGVSCAACHATVDRETGMVIEGAPNLDFNAGMMLALASNSTAYFTNTDIDAEKIKAFIEDHDRTVETTDGNQEALPDPQKLEQAVDEMLVQWPPGNFDSTMDLVNNPAQIPDSFTLGDHPYGWNGFAAVGPFKGLSSLNNNVHAQNSDLLAQADQSNDLFEIDKEVYIATILQNAANPNYRYDPESGQKPSEFMKVIDEEPAVPGVNEMVKPPTFPKISMFSPNGTVINSPGFHFGEQINAMSAYQNSLIPPKYEIDENTKAQGRDVFERGGCISCHAGPAYTNNRVIDNDIVKAQPSRAKAFEDTVKLMEDSWIYSFDTPVPIPKEAKAIRVPTEHVAENQKKLVLAQDENKSGGYKVKGLIGLKWSPPYLHDGGVAVGPNEKKDLGIPGTLHKTINPDPYNSLKAMIDSNLRKKVVKANRKSKALQGANVEGIGHEHWVDQTTGFSKEEQDALIEFLLSITSSDDQIDN
ncbi:electron transport protein [Alkalihalobacterium elongatum]|uniref:electron transport protein n=1 Tax=Alkalihalobacterium elongatum TaxID=2675466 RepID=UPI001C1F8EAD|nr:electron transport protein [Alkalihalobacterium elongatum]